MYLEKEIDRLLETMPAHSFSWSDSWLYIALIFWLVATVKIFASSESSFRTLWLSIISIVICTPVILFYCYGIFMQTPTSVSTWEKETLQPFLHNIEPTTVKIESMTVGSVDHLNKTPAAIIFSVDEKLYTYKGYVELTKDSSLTDNIMTFQTLHPAIIKFFNDSFVLPQVHVKNFSSITLDTDNNSKDSIMLQYEDVALPASAEGYPVIFLFLFCLFVASGICHAIAISSDINTLRHLKQIRESSVVPVETIDHDDSNSDSTEVIYEIPEPHNPTKRKMRT